MASPGESLNLEVMSPVTVAYLLEAISDLNKTNDINKVRRYSGPKPGGKALQGKCISSDGRSLSSEGEEEDDSSSASPGSISNHGNGITLPPVSTVFSNDLLKLSCTAAQIIPPSPTVVDVTNGLQQHRQQSQQHQQQNEHQHGAGEQTSYTTQQPLVPKRRSSVSRKRSIEVDDVSDDEDDIDAEESTQRSKKRSRSSSLSDENCSPQRPRLSSSTQPTAPSSKPNSSTELDNITTTTAVVQPTVKGPPRVCSDKNANTNEANKKRSSRSRRFKEDELAFLDAVYKTEPYPDPMITERLSIQLDVPEHRIKVWFANRRHRQSKDREINKPHPITKPVITEKSVMMEKTVPIEKPQQINMEEKDHQLVTETAALPAESSHASSAFPSSPSFTSQYGMVPSGYEYTHQPLTPSPLPTPPPQSRAPVDLAAAESHLRAQFASTIQSQFPFSSPALIQLANQTMLSRSRLNPYHPAPLHYPVGHSMPSGGLTLPPGPGAADYCDLARMPRRRPSYSYYVEPPILPPLTAESTSYTDGVSLSPAIDDGPSPWHWMR